MLILFKNYFIFGEAINEPDPWDQLEGAPCHDSGILAVTFKK